MMKKMASIAVASALLVGLTSATMADVSKANFDYVELGYSQLDLEDSDEIGSVDFDGYVIEGSFTFADNFFASANYDLNSNKNFDAVDVEVQQIELNVGYQYGITRETSLYGSVDYYDKEATLDSGVQKAAVSSDGFGVTAGVRSFIAESFEIDAAVSYADIEGSEVYLSLGAHYYFTPQFSVGARYKDLDGADITSVSARYSF